MMMEEMTNKEKCELLNAVFSESGIRYTDEEKGVLEITSCLDRDDCASFMIKQDGDDEAAYRLFILNAAELLELSAILHDMAGKLLENVKDIKDPTPFTKKESIRPVRFRIEE